MRRDSPRPSGAMGDDGALLGESVVEGIVTGYLGRVVRNGNARGQLSAIEAAQSSDNDSPFASESGVDPQCGCANPARTSNVGFSSVLRPNGRCELAR
jgi:hypothetical protein